MCCAGLLLAACGEPAGQAGSEAQGVVAGPLLEIGVHTFAVELEAYSDLGESTWIDGAQSAEFVLTGELTLGRSDELTRLRFADSTTIAFEVGGAQGEPRVHELLGCEGWLAVGDGPPTVLHAKGPTETCQLALTHVGLALDFGRAGTDVPVLTSYGPMAATYLDGGSTVARSVYGEIDGRRGRGESSLEREATGSLVSIDSRTWLSDDGDEGRPVSSTRVSLERVATSVDPVSPPDDDLQVYPLLEAVDGTTQAREQARAFAEGLDRGMLGLWLAHVERGGELPDGFAIRSRGLMIAEPGLAADVGALFDRARRPESRQLLLDLLSQAGTELAQAELRRLLAGVVRDQAVDRGVLLQRLGLLDAPNRASLELALDLHDAAVATGDSHTRAAVLHVLGMVVESTGPELAGLRQLALGRLAADAGGSMPTDIRKAALAGLGNAGTPATLELILTGTMDPDPTVRSTAALALRKLPRSKAWPALERLSRDPSRAVVDAAQVAMSRFEES